MKKLIYEIPVHDDNDGEMIAREIEAILGIRPARVEEVALLRDKREGDSGGLGEGDPSALSGVRDDMGRDSSSLRSLGMTSGQNDMGVMFPEEFLSWAEGYFGDDGHRNVRLRRRELYEAYLAEAPGQRKFCTATTFKRLIIGYCAYKGYRLNPQKYDRLTGLPCDFDRDGQPVLDDKSEGIEYFTVGDGREG